MLDDKAQENIEAAERLLQNEEGRDCLPNAVANRAYYAAYLAAAHVAQKVGLPFTSERNYYRHDTLPDVAVARRLISRTDADVLSWLYAVRIKADYTDTSVDLDEANQAFDRAKSFVEKLLP